MRGNSKTFANKPCNNIKYIAIVIVLLAFRYTLPCTCSKLRLPTSWLATSSYNMGTRDLPDSYTYMPAPSGPAAALGPGHIRQANQSQVHMLC